MTTHDAPQSPAGLPQPRPSAAARQVPVAHDGIPAPARPDAALSVPAPVPTEPPGATAPAYAAADAAGAENLLRCWVRETGTAAPADGILRVPLAATGCVLRIPVRYWSATGHHRFGSPTVELPASGRSGTTAERRAGAPMGAENPSMAGENGTTVLENDAVAAENASMRPENSTAAKENGTLAAGHPPDRAEDTTPCDAGSTAHATRSTDGDTARPGPALDAVTLAALLAREAAYGTTETPGGPSRGRGVAEGAAERADLVARVADSVRRTALFVTVRSARPATPPGTPPFLAAEQALVLGHPVHPAPKSREGLSDAETAAYSPETRGSLQLRWLAVDHSVLASDSGWTTGGRHVPAHQLTRQLAGPRLLLPEGTAALPVHPWQARALRERPRVRALFNAGLLHDLGPAGDAWSPTSSVRTLYRPGAPAMLKLSLGVRITNSRRENLRKELLRGLEVHRLLRGPVGRRWREECPGFDIVRDPAWIGVDGPGGDPVAGLDVVLRHVPFGPGEDVGCLAGLTAPGPQGAWRSPLADITLRLAARTGRPAEAVATEWFLRYLDTVVHPVLRLDALAGVALEAHQQNTLVALDPLGWPRGGWYRDNQGYYFRESRRVTLEAALPGIGVDSDTFVEDAVADERFAYYLGINNVLGLIGAFGSQRLAREEVLLAAFRHFLAREAAAPDASPLPRILLDRPALRCKANLLTRLHGLDELVGPVDTQSVYVTLTNPLAAPAA